MKKYALYLLIFLFFTTAKTFSQFSEDDYRKQADEIRNDIWNSKTPFFDQRSVPEGYEKYSKVILARRQEITCVGASKTKFIPFYGFTKQNDLTYTTVFRELVKINDEVSLQDYSEISFQKFSHYAYSKKTSFLGFRIIKPDGSVKEINPDEIVLTDDDKNYKKAKLAVSDLQIGDMVDYFIETVSSYTGSSGILYNEFEFAEEDPMLHYSIHIELNNALNLQYLNMNGAPEFKVSSDGERNVILDAEQKNIQQYPVNLWLSRYRQIPLTRIKISPGVTKSNDPNNNVTQERGSSGNTPSHKILTYWKSVFETYRPFAKKKLYANMGKIRKLAASYFQINGGPANTNSTGYYYAARHFFFLQPDKKNVAVDDLAYNYSTLESIFFLSVLQILFDENNFDAQLIIIPSRFGPKAGEAMYGNDFGLALLTNDKHIYTARSVFDCPDQLPYYLEGQPPTSLYKYIDFISDVPDQGWHSLKTSPAANNTHTENLTVSFDPADPEKIKVNRKTILTGQAKIAAQKNLVIDEDYYEEERKAMGISESFIDELNDTKKGKKIESEYASAFSDIRKQWKEDVKDEIQTQFNLDEAALSDCNIEQAGIFHNRPEFIYNTNFTVNAWVKTAGNNYILEVGKMATPTLKLTPAHRERKVDVYMPYARIFQYNVEIPVPDGFSVEGIDKLNTSLENTTGSFVTTASLDSGKLVLHVTQTFNNAFEKGSKWEELLAVLDAATGFENAKILLKKL